MCTSYTLDPARTINQAGNLLPLREDEYLIVYRDEYYVATRGSTPEPPFTSPDPDPNPYKVRQVDGVWCVLYWDSDDVLMKCESEQHAQEERWLQYWTTDEVHYG